MITVGEKCKECMYWSNRSQSCDYRLITGQSRCVTNNIRNDPKLCDKFTKGEYVYDKHDWNKEWYRNERNI